MAVITRRDGASYAAELMALLPTGFSWPREPGTVWAAVLAGLAEGLAAADSRLWDLLAEADPRGAVELLPDWERLCGLPDACLSNAEQTVAERRAAVVTRLTATGGASAAYFIGLAAGLGRTISISEYTVARVGTARIGDRLYSPPWAYAFLVRVHGHDVGLSLARVGAAGVGDRLRTGAAYPITLARVGTARIGGRLVNWQDKLIECLIRRLKPAHTIALFAYGEPHS